MQKTFFLVNWTDLHISQRLCFFKLPTSFGDTTSWCYVPGGT